MRFMIAFVFAAVVLIPTAAPAQAAGVLQLTAQPGAATDLSSTHTKKHKAKTKPAKKEEYLRAVPSTPPAGAKQ